MFDGIEKMNTTQSYELNENMMDLFNNCDEIFSINDEKKRMSY